MNTEDNVKQLNGTAFMFVAICILVVASVSYGIGKQSCREVYPPIGYGSPSPNTPVMAVYEQNGVLYGVSAMNHNGEALMEFNIKGGPVAYATLEPCDFWFPLSAEWTEVVK